MVEDGVLCWHFAETEVALPIIPDLSGVLFGEDEILLDVHDVVSVDRVQVAPLLIHFDVRLILDLWGLQSEFAIKAQIIWLYTIYFRLLPLLPFHSRLLHSFLFGFLFLNFEFVQTFEQVLVLKFNQFAMIAFLFDLQEAMGIKKATTCSSVCLTDEVFVVDLIAGALGICF